MSVEATSPRSSAALLTCSAPVRVTAVSSPAPVSLAQYKHSCSPHTQRGLLGFSVWEALQRCLLLWLPVASLAWIPVLPPASCPPLWVLLWPSFQAACCRGCVATCCQFLWLDLWRSVQQRLSVFCHAGHFLHTSPRLLQTTWKSLPAVRLCLLLGLSHTCVLAALQRDIECFDQLLDLKLP